MDMEPRRAASSPG